MLTRFQQVSTRATKNLPCPECGKKVRRSTTITNTINPFNRNADGAVKTYAEVRANVVALADEWKAEPVTCSACAQPKAEAAKQAAGSSQAGEQRD